MSWGNCVGLGAGGARLLLLWEVVMVHGEARTENVIGNLASVHVYEQRANEFLA